MINSEFVFWLNGYLSLSGSDSLTKKQLIIIQNHLKLVFAIEGFLIKENKFLSARIKNLLTSFTEDKCFPLRKIFPPNLMDFYQRLPAKKEATA